jgi:hypothetical protein
MKPLNPVIPRSYADQFRQNEANRGTSNTQGAPVAPPCRNRHIIGNAGKPETGKK